MGQALTLSTATRAYEIISLSLTVTTINAIKTFFSLRYSREEEATKRKPMGLGEFIE
jgi:hypothetical protein